MTAQIPDKVIFKKNKYSLISMNGGELITPLQFGMIPEMIHTACYRGFHTTYEITSDGLYLRELTMKEKDDKFLPIGGVLPEQERAGFEAVYHDLDVFVPFTGKIRLADGLIPEHCINMGFQSATAFKIVQDITLSGGKVVSVLDRSSEVEARRGEFKRRYESADIVDRLHMSFSRDMDLEEL
jgi:hypothetical protein